MNCKSKVSCYCSLCGVSPNDIDGASDADSENIEFDAHESRPHKLKRKPDEPSEEEVAQHYAQNHVPARNWCKHCIMGKGISEPHKRI